MKMEHLNETPKKIELPLLKQWPLPGKILVTAIIIMLAAGLVVAGGQILIHDVIPTFSAESHHAMENKDIKEEASGGRGDLFASGALKKKEVAFYETEQFIFALKFSHIHIFGMGAIFFVMGSIVLFLDLKSKTKVLLIALPFIGVIVDLASVWLKLFVHPAFFWLHIPGGALFGTIFAADSILALKQTWMLRE